MHAWMSDAGNGALFREHCSIVLDEYVGSGSNVVDEYDRQYNRLGSICEDLADDPRCSMSWKRPFGARICHGVVKERT